MLMNEDIWKELNEFVDFGIKRFYRITSSSTTIKRQGFSRGSLPAQLEHLDSESCSDELNRAAISFLHSLIEETLRNLVFLIVKNNSYMLIEWHCRNLTFNLDEILQSEGSSKYDYLYSLASRKMKIFDRDKSRKKIIESLEDYLWRQSISTTKDIETILAFANIIIDDFEKRNYFPVLNKIFNRRHSIVHNMDYKKGELMSINEEEIDTWADNAYMFLKNIISKII